MLTWRVKKTVIVERMSHCPRSTVAKNFAKWRLTQMYAGKKKRRKKPPSLYLRSVLLPLHSSKSKWIIRRFGGGGDGGGGVGFHCRWHTTVVLRRVRTKFRIRDWIDGWRDGWMLIQFRTSEGVTDTVLKRQWCHIFPISFYFMACFMDTFISWYRIHMEKTIVSKTRWPVSAFLGTRKKTPNNEVLKWQKRQKSRHIYRDRLKNDRGVLPILHHSILLIGESPRKWSCSSWPMMVITN